MDIFRAICPLFALAQRGIFHNSVLLGQMDTKIFHKQLTVEDVLKKWPKSYLVFRDRNTDCIGCLLQRFCSIQDVAEAYEIMPQDLISDLEKCVEENYQSPRSIL
jgi:hypothetical protein